MSRKTIFIIALIIILLLGGLFGALFFVSKDLGEPVGETLKTFLPFGLGGEDVSFPERNNGENDVGEFPSGSDIQGEGDSAPENNIETVISKTGVLRQLSVVPTAGIFTSTDSVGTTEVSYVERQTGHIYTVPTDGRAKNRISNTTIPGIREVAWGNIKNTLIIRYLDDNDVIKSFFGIITETGQGPDGTLEGTFLSNDIQTIAASPGKIRKFTLLPFGNSLIGTISDFDDKNKKEVFNSSFTEWTASWPEENTISLATKPSGNAEGFLYFLNLKTLNLQKVVGGVNGLTALTSPEATRVLYSQAEKNGFTTHLYNVPKKTSSMFLLTTLPEKCAWSKIASEIIYCAVPEIIPQGTYPDNWYQGVLSFSDTIWKVNVENGIPDILARPRELTGQGIDLIDPVLTENEEYLIFRNKKDSTLWSLKIAD